MLFFQMLFAVVVVVVIVFLSVIPADSPGVLRWQLAVALPPTRRDLIGFGSKPNGEWCNAMPCIEALLAVTSWTYTRHHKSFIIDGGQCGRARIGRLGKPLWHKLLLTKRIFCLPNSNANKIYVRLGWWVKCYYIHQPMHIHGDPGLSNHTKCIALQVDVDCNVGIQEKRRTRTNIQGLGCCV